MTLPSAPETQRVFTLADFDFHLPPELIAQHPPAERSGSRLLDGRQATPADRRFAELADLLKPGDLLVFNDTRVIKARLFGSKATGGRVEVLVERVLSDDRALVHLRASNTEPIIRIIAEAATAERANALCDECARVAGV